MNGNGFNPALISEPEGSLDLMVGNKTPQQGYGTERVQSLIDEPTVDAIRQGGENVLAAMLQSVRSTAVRAFLGTDVGKQMQAEATRQTIQQYIDRYLPVALAIGVALLGLSFLRRF